MGEIPPNPDTPLVINQEDNLIFELRVLEDPTGTLETIVCESIGDSPLRPSEVLLTRTTTPLRSCLQEFGSFSQPYVVDVRVRRDSSILTERKVVVVFGTDCDTAEIRSRVFNVIGQ